MRFWGVILVILVLDQGSKYFVQSYMELGQSIGVINNLLNFTYVLNPGAAFGFLPYQTGLFIIITVLVIIFIVYYNYHLPASYSIMRMGLALQLGGAAGNLIDRVRTGYVIDFFDISFFPPIFNIADTAIIFGILFFVFSLWDEGRQIAIHEQSSGASRSGFHVRFKRSTIGYSPEEVDKYLDRVDANLEVFMVANEQIKEQIKRLNNEIQILKDSGKTKEESLKASRESLGQIKQEAGVKTEKVKIESKDKIEEMRQNYEAAMLENINLKQEIKLLTINKDNYIKLIKVMEESLSIVYYLASTLRNNVELLSKALMREADEICREVPIIKEKAVILHENALNENENLKVLLNNMNEKLNEYKRNEKYITNAISISESISKKINNKAREEAESIRKETQIEAQQIINDAISYEDIIFSEYDEYRNICRIIWQNNVKVKKILTEKLSLIDNEEIFP